MKLRLIIGFLFVVIVSSSCRNTSNQRDTDLDSQLFKEAEESKNFRDLSTFLLENPQSKHFQQALLLYQNRMDAYFDSIDLPVIDCFRNCATIGIKANQVLEYEFEIIELKSLQDSLAIFFENDNGDRNCAEKREIKDINGKTQRISKGHVEIEYIKDSCQILQNVISEINSSIKSYKEFLAIKWYDKKLAELPVEAKNQIDSLLRYRLILYGWDKERIVPPPPPPPYVDTILNE